MVMKFWSKGRRYRSRLLAYSMACGIIFITISMIQYPKEAFDSAVMGLNLWWNVVFPSLLPFFILSEILMGCGVVHFIGVLLEPLMRPVFNVPGVGAFAMSMGLASGYPMDAVITCKFRKNQLCSAVEAERLLSFTNTADPLFMFGAVAVGMFAMPELGTTIALAHYLSSFLVGILFRFHGRNRDIPAAEERTGTGNIIFRAFRALYNARQQDNRPIGKLLGDSVTSSINTILLIGGFIILFAVFLRIISIVGLTGFITAFFSGCLSFLGLSTSLAPALVSGLFELDIGSMLASQADAPLAERVAIASVIIAWSGLSVHGQVASIVIESGIRMTPYMVARLLHAVFAGVLTFMLLGPAQEVAKLITVPAALTITGSGTWSFWLMRTEQLIYQLVLVTAIFITISISLYLIKTIWTRTKS